MAASTNLEGANNKLHHSTTTLNDYQKQVKSKKALNQKVKLIAEQVMMRSQ
jgi:hypothetical protein